MWKILTDAVRGTSHEKSDLPCQDSCHAVELEVGGEVFLVAACADGAGSALASDIGSRAAVEFFTTHCARQLQVRAGFGETEMRAAYGLASDSLVALAAERGLAVRDLACTLLTAVVGEHTATFGQVGDGAIVTRDGTGSLAPVFWPEPPGEYANETVFLTSPTVRDALLLHVGDTIDALAMFSDGLQRLALNFTNRSAHPRFFEPMFAALETQQPDDLVVDLRMFLGSTAVNARTDDDKSLVIAKRCSAQD
jgi:hypothetical protein